MTYTRARRVGLAVLDSDLTAEQELRALLPPDVALYANRVAYPPAVSEANLRRAVAGLEAAVRSLAAVRPHVVVWACTSGSVLGDEGAHARLLADLRDWSGGATPVTAAGAVIAALQRHRARRVGLATPYPPAVRDLLQARLAAAGFDVVSTVDAFPEPVDDWTLQALDADEIAALARRADRPDADAVVVSCTGLAGARVARLASDELGKPVLTSNTAIALTVADALERVNA